MVRMAALAVFARPRGRRHARVPAPSHNAGDKTFLSRGNANEQEEYDVSFIPRGLELKSEFLKIATFQLGKCSQLLKQGHDFGF